MKQILEHPIATIIIIIVLFNCIVNVINAFKGTDNVPIINLKVNLVSTSGDNNI